MTKPNQWIDGHGVTQTVKIDIPKAGKVNRDFGVDLIGCMSDPMKVKEALSKVLDPETLVGVLATLCEYEDPDTFGSGFDSADVLEDAIGAFMEALLAFIPASIAGPMQIVWEKSHADMMKKREAMMEALNRAAEAYSPTA